jgi:hypothetical protein
VRYAAHPESVIVPADNPVTKAQSATAAGFLHTSEPEVVVSQTHNPSVEPLVQAEAAPVYKLHVVLYS